MLFEYVPLYVELFNSGTFALFSTPGTANYAAYFAPLVYAEIILNSALACAWLAAGVLLFTRRRLFPRLYIGILLFSPAFIGRARRKEYRMFFLFNLIVSVVLSIIDGVLGLIAFVPLIGGIVLLVFMVLDSTAGDNQYGPNPKESLVGAVA